MKISAGAIHTHVFLMGDRTVWAVGSNEYGRLGDGTTVNRMNSSTGGGQLWQSAGAGWWISQPV